MRLHVSFSFQCSPVLAFNDLILSWNGILRTRCYSPWDSALILLLSLDVYSDI